jgi:predicted nucleic acid-binding protein
MPKNYMNKAVVDANVLVAVIDERDKWHVRTSSLLEALRFQNIEIVWFDCVVNETISVLARRTQEQKRSEQLARLFESLIRMIPAEQITWVSSENQRLYYSVIELIRNSDGALNFNDALMSLCCREYGIKLIVTFDQDFDQISWLTRIEKPEDLQLLQ